MWQEIQDKDKWDKLVSAQPRAPFLQSWQWGEFQESWGREVLRLSWHDEILAQAIKMPLSLGKYYWYIPHGPVVIKEPTDVAKILQAFAAELSKGGALFFRIDPVYDFMPSPDDPGIKEHGRKLCFVPATQPQCTRILDIAKAEDDLLKEMHQKTRYNIKVAEKNNVIVQTGSIEDFLKLYHQTAQRDKFKQNPDNWLADMARHLMGESGAAIKVWIASYNTVPVAGSMTAYFGDMVTYLHGASSNENRNIMAPYLLHWEIIKDAKKSGYHYYDFRGVNPGNANHPTYKKSWEGITRFKTGFGGEFVSNPPSFDLIYRTGWYSLYRLLHKVRRFL